MKEEESPRTSNSMAAGAAQKPERSGCLEHLVTSWKAAVRRGLKAMLTPEEPYLYLNWYVPGSNQYWAMAEQYRVSAQRAKHESRLSALRQVTIRPARSNDLEVVIGLWKELMNDPAAFDAPIPTHAKNEKIERGFIGALIESDSRQVLLASDSKGKAIGYLVYQKDRVTRLEMGRQTSYISDVYVGPEYRRLGVGRALLRRCIDDLESSSSAEVSLAVWTENKNAKRLYRSLGFADSLVRMKLELKV